MGGNVEAFQIEEPIGEHFTVCYMISNGLKDNLVREVIEKALDICVQNDVKTGGMQLQSMVNGHVAVCGPG